jgi:hypothetical protein
MVQQATATRFGLSPKNQKWAQVVVFASAYRVHHQGYCHLVVSTMAVLILGGMFRYNDGSRLRWRNLEFEEYGSFMDLKFDR